MGKGKGGGNVTKKVGRNDDRKCGKGFKKNPKTGREGANGKTVGGYSPAKLEIRAILRKMAKSK